jgi:hypothetical protein
MDFQNLVKAMIKPLKWQKMSRSNGFFSEDEDYSVFKDPDDGVIYLETQDQEDQMPYPSLAKAKEAANEHNRARIMAALAEVMDFSPEKAVKRLYPQAELTNDRKYVCLKPNTDLRINTHQTTWQKWAKTLATLNVSTVFEYDVKVLHPNAKAVFGTGGWQVYLDSDVPFAHGKTQYEAWYNTVNKLLNQK